jgi:hypothetical protein
MVADAGKDEAFEARSSSWGSTQEKREQRMNHGLTMRKVDAQTDFHH